MTQLGPPNVGRRREGLAHGGRAYSQAFGRNRYFDPGYKSAERRGIGVHPRPMAGQVRSPQDNCQTGRRTTDSLDG